MEEALVSVILPTYNRAAYLPRAMESVLSQSYTNIELIVIDDGSSDSTREVVEKTGDGRIVFMRTPTNRGVVAARNAGIRRAKGKYIAFQDSDDMWLPGKLAKQVEVLEQSTEEIGMVYCVMSRTFMNGQKEVIPGPGVAKAIRQGRIFESILFSNFIGAPTACIRSSVLKSPEGVGVFDPQIPNCEDWELMLRIARKYKIAYIDEVLVDTFDLPDSTNRNLFYGVVSHCMIIQKYEKELKEIGTYQQKIEAVRNFGAKINAQKEVEEIIQKYCGV